MNPDQLDLARRLARCPQYKPEPVTADYTRRLCGTRVLRDANGTLIPDLTDAATGGVLWEMAGKPAIHVARPVGEPEEARARPNSFPLNTWCAGLTLAEACARALLAEWGANPATPETTAS